MRNTDSDIVGGYVDAGGTTHDLVVRKADPGGWQALDVYAEAEHVIDTVIDHQDDRPQAEVDRPRLPHGRPLRSGTGARRAARPYLSREEQMPTATAVRAPQRASSAPAGLRCRIRLADWRTFTGELPPERHRSLQIGLVHQDTEGLVELAAGVRRDGRLQITTRRRRDHFLPGGGSRGDGWREALLELAARHADKGEEVFIAPARGIRGEATSTPCAPASGYGSTSTSPASYMSSGHSSPSAHATSWWRAEVRAACTPTGNSTQPLPATRSGSGTGELVEPIERANLRIVHRLGVGEDGKPNVADPACAERSRVMRLAGTVNGKTGAYARIVEADLALPAYSIEQLVGDLPDPALHTTGRARREGPSTDPYKRISPPEYFEKLAGIVVPRDGLVSCPAPGHVDRNPSCSVGTSPDHGWCCHAGGCGARGAIYDLASVLLGGPWGHGLRGEAFERARAYVADAFGEPGGDHDGTATDRPSERSRR